MGKMKKLGLLEEFVEFAKDRHEKGKCGCEKHEGGGDSGEEHKHDEELNEEELQKLKTVFDEITAKDGSGFMVMKTEKENRFFAHNVNRIEVVAALTVVLGNVISEVKNERMREILLTGATNALKHFYGGAANALKHFYGNID